MCHVDEGNYTKTLFTCFLLQIHFALKLKKGWKIVSTRRIDQLVPETVQKFLVVPGARTRKVFLYIEEYIGIIAVKIKRCNRNLY